MFMSTVLAAFQEEPPPVDVHISTPSIDFGAIGKGFVDALLGGMPHLVQSAADASVPALQSTAPTLATSAGQSFSTGGGAILDALQANPLNVLTNTPPQLTYSNEVVLRLQDVTFAAAIAALALIVVWAGLQVIVRSTMAGPSFEELVGRLVIGVAMLAAVRVGTGWTLEGMNRLSDAMVGARVTWTGLNVTVDLLDGGGGLLLTIVTVLGALWLYITMWGRIVLIDILLVFAPLAVVCWVLPQTRGWFSLWVRNFFGWALVGPAVTLVLVIGLTISSSLGVGDTPSRLSALIVSMAVFIVGATKVPPMVVSGWGQSIGSSAVMGMANTAVGAVTGGGGSAVAALFRAATHK